MGKKEKHSRNAFVKNIGCKVSFLHSLNENSLKRNLDLFNTRFGSNYVLSVVEELCFTHGCDSDALCVLGSIEIGTTRKYLIQFTTDFNFGVFRNCFSFTKTDDD